MTAVATSSVGAAALQLRVSGASFDDVARTLGLSSAKAAIRTVTNELAARAEEDVDGRTRLRAEQSMALEELRKGVWDKATDPESDEHIPAIRTAVTIMDRQAKLHGLDAPSEVVVHTPTQTELDQWVSTMVRSTMPTVEMADPDVMLGIIEVESFESDDDD